MYSLILYGRRSLELQKWRHLRVSAKLFQNASSFPNSFSSAADLSPQVSRKGKNFTVSYLVDSLGLTRKVAESISKKVSFEEKGNPDSVLNLLTSYGFTDSQVSSIVTGYPQLLVADAEKSLGPKLQVMQSRGASTSELTDIVSTVPKIMGKRGGKTISAYYDLFKEIIEADKSSNYVKLSHSLPEGSKQANIIRNVSVLRELGMPQKMLFSLLTSRFQPVSGKEKFKESLKKVIEMGFNPTTLRFVQALRMLYRLSDKTIQEKINVIKRLGFAEEDVWEMFKKSPTFLTFSEKKILNSIETFLGLGFSKDEVTMMIKCSPQCVNLSAETVKNKTEFLVKKMNWPLKAVALRPQVLGFSMEKRIIPRCNVVKALMSKGSKLPPMQSVLTCTDDKFLKRYVKKHQDKELVADLMDIFTTTGGRVS